MQLMLPQLMCKLHLRSRQPKALHTSYFFIVIKMLETVPVGL